MRLRGWCLWREDAHDDATWVRGEWVVRAGTLHRVPTTSLPADLEGWVVPGLVDVHAHIGIGSHGPAPRAEQEAQALADRDSGVLAIRDCGVPVDNSWIHSRVDLPRLVRSGRHIARPLRYIRDLPREVEPADLPRAVAEEARRGDGWVKIVGDWIDRSRGVDSDLDPLWPRPALVDAVAAAHESGARVTVHSFSHSALDDLLDAGVDGIEHATGMDDDQLSRAVEAGVYITPTLMQVELFADFAAQAGTRYPVYGETMTRMWTRRREHAERLFDSGVRILPGTDSGGYQRHGSLPRELAMWADLGVDTTRVLDLATWRARDALGIPSLHDGAPADLVVLPEDPREDIAVLTRPRAVVLRGRRVGRA